MTNLIQLNQEEQQSLQEEIDKTIDPFLNHVQKDLMKKLHNDYYGTKKPKLYEKYSIVDTIKFDDFSFDVEYFVLNSAFQYKKKKYKLSYKFLCYNDKAIYYEISPYFCSQHRPPNIDYRAYHLILYEIDELLYNCPLPNTENEDALLAKDILKYYNISLNSSLNDFFCLKDNLLSKIHYYLSLRTKEDMKRYFNNTRSATFKWHGKTRFNVRTALGRDYEESEYFNEYVHVKMMQEYNMIIDTFNSMMLYRQM